MTIKVTYNVTDVYMSQSVSPVYINVSYSDGGASGGGVWGTITGTLSNQTDLQNALNAKVPYSGATGDVSLGEYGINVGNVIYDTTPTGIPTDQGATYWDADAETVALIMNGTIQKVGEDTFYHVRNTTGSTIAKGTAVRFSGTTGNSGRLLIAPMLADGTYPSQYYMGITSEEIANNQDGKVYHFGKMRGVNTSAFADGDVLYVSPSVAGALTATAPVAPNNIIVAAAVVHAANNGTLMIRTTLGSNINADEGVLLTTPTANQGLFYDSGLWVNKSITTALGFTPANAATTLTINGVTYDLSANRSWTIAAGISGSGTSGQVTYWTGASAVSGSNNLFWDNANGRLGIGTNAPQRPFHIYSNSGMWIQSPTGGNSILVFTPTGLDTLNGSFIDFSVSANSRMRLTTNLMIGTTTDLGYRLGVIGDTLLRGSGATSATTALTVQNSSSTNLFVVRNDGNVGIGTNAPNSPLTVIGNAFFGGASPSIFMNGSATNQTALISNANGNIASLILRCAQIKFEDGNSVQKLLLSTTGNLILQNGGTFTDAGQRLQVYGDTLLRGSGATSATTALTVQNSSSTNLFTVRNDGNVGLRSTIPAVVHSSTAFMFVGRAASLTSGDSVNDIGFNNNSYFDGTNSIYRNSGFASTLFLDNAGDIRLFTAASGTAGSIITYTEMFRLLNNGNLIIQNGGTYSNISSSRLTINSTTQGFLPPRMTTTQKNAIATPAAGLVVYDTTLNKLCVYTTAWETITSI